MQRNKGFTLIELLVVIAILGVFTAVAHPFYREYQLKTARTLAQSEVLKAFSDLQTSYQTNGTYSGITPFGSQSSKLFPATKPLYNLVYTVGADGQSFNLIATPVRGMFNQADGDVCMNNLGQKLWRKGLTGCTLLSNTSTWYGE